MPRRNPEGAAKQSTGKCSGRRKCRGQRAVSPPLPPPPGCTAARAHERTPPGDTRQRSSLTVTVGPAHAATTIDVTTTAQDGSGGCCLSEAIIAANTDSNAHAPECTRS